MLLGEAINSRVLITERRIDLEITVSPIPIVQSFSGNLMG